MPRPLEHGCAFNKYSSKASLHVCGGCSTWASCHRRCNEDPSCRFFSFPAAFGSARSADANGMSTCCLHSECRDVDRHGRALVAPLVAHQSWRKLWKVHKQTNCYTLGACPGNACHLGIRKHHTSKGFDAERACAEHCLAHPKCAAFTLGSAASMERPTCYTRLGVSNLSACKKDQKFDTFVLRQIG